MSLEIRLEKPSQPIKWTLPSDLSLVKALEKARSTSNPSQTHTNSNICRHEKYFTSGTYISMCMEMYRRVYDSIPQVDSDVYAPFKLLKPRGKAESEGDGEVGGEDEGSRPTSSPAKDTKKKSTNPPNSSKKSTRKAQESKANLTASELDETLRITPFTRMVIMLPYLDDERVREINRGLEEVNMLALPNIQGSIRSYSLNADEIVAAEQGEMDILSGVMVLDDEVRILVLEGLAKPGGGIEKLYVDYLFREEANTTNYKVLCNPTILFPTRLYAPFSPDVKRIRVRGTLKNLVQKPDVYNRLQVDMMCYSAIDKLMALCLAQDLYTTKSLDMYPTIESLNKLELLYGEAISRTDMDGTLRIEFLRQHESRKGRRETEANMRATMTGISTSPTGRITPHVYLHILYTIYHTLYTCTSPYRRRPYTQACRVRVHGLSQPRVRTAP
ncbi:hypothetical protein EON63_11720 [archaeon]|nr:MAG: hypothetical protein EON63_11720 [archaeon]